MSRRRQLIATQCQKAYACSIRTKGRSMDDPASHLRCFALGAIPPPFRCLFETVCTRFFAHFHWLTDCLGNLASGLGAADELASSLTNRLLRFGNLYEVIQAALRAHDCGFRFPGPTHKTAGQLDRARPLCPYPQVAHYKGTGSIDDASNSTCSWPQSRAASERADLHSSDQAVSLGTVFSPVVGKPSLIGLRKEPSPK